MDDRVAVEIVDAVAHVRMVRGEKMNALDNRMFEALRETGRELGENPLPCEVYRVTKRWGRPVPDIG